MTPTRSSHTPAWLTPQLGIQVGTLLISLAGFSFSIKGDMRSFAEEQARQAEAIREIRQQLPNGGVLEMRLQRLEEADREMRTDLRLLSDYTRGRVGHLPYRPENVSPTP